MEGLGCFGVKPLFQGRKRGAYMDVFTTESIHGVFTEKLPNYLSRVQVNIILSVGEMY